MLWPRRNGGPPAPICAHPESRSGALCADHDQVFTPLRLIQASRSSSDQHPGANRAGCAGSRERRILFPHPDVLPDARPVAIVQDLHAEPARPAVWQGAPVERAAVVMRMARPPYPSMAARRPCPSPSCWTRTRRGTCPWPMRRRLAASGLTPTAMLRAVQMCHACALLAGGGEPLPMAGLICGSSKQGNFPREFRRRVNMTPDVCRRLLHAPRDRRGGPARCSSRHPATGTCYGVVSEAPAALWPAAMRLAAATGSTGSGLGCGPSGSRHSSA